MVFFLPRPERSATVPIRKTFLSVPGVSNVGVLPVVRERRTFPVVTNRTVVSNCISVGFKQGGFGDLGRAFPQGNFGEFGKCFPKAKALRHARGGEVDVSPAD